MRLSIDYLKEVIPERDYWDCEEVLRDLADSSARLTRDNNVTILTLEKDHATVSGWAKRNPNDDPDIPERGKAIAVVRAFRALRDHGWQEH